MRESGGITIEMIKYLDDRGKQKQDMENCKKLVDENNITNF